MLHQSRSASPRAELSPREAQLLELAANGLTDTAIALKLGISEATVSTYWGRVRIKLGPYSRTELVSIVLRQEQEEALQRLREENETLVQELRERLQASTDQDALANQIIDNAPDAIVLVSGDGVVRQANARAQELFGYAEGEMNGLPLIELIPERLRQVHQAHREEYVQDPSRRSMGEHLETPALRKDGTEFLVRATLSALATPSGLLVTCVLRAIG